MIKKTEYIKSNAFNSDKDLFDWLSNNLPYYDKYKSLPILSSDVGYLQVNLPEFRNHFKAFEKPEEEVLKIYVYEFSDGELYFSSKENNPSPIAKRAPQFDITIKGEV